MPKQDFDFSTMSAYELIEFLAADFPHQCIRPGEPEWAAHRYAGRRELIDELVAAMNNEREDRSDD